MQQLQQQHHHQSKLEVVTLQFYAFGKRTHAQLQLGNIQPFYQYNFLGNVLYLLGFSFSFAVLILKLFCVNFFVVEIFLIVQQPGSEQTSLPHEQTDLFPHPSKRLSSSESKVHSLEQNQLTAYVSTMRNEQLKQKQKRK